MWTGRVSLPPMASVSKPDPGDMPKGTLRAILKQAGIEPEMFLQKKQHTQMPALSCLRVGGQASASLPVSPSRATGAMARWCQGRVSQSTVLRRKQGFQTRCHTFQDHQRPNWPAPEPVSDYPADYRAAAFGCFLSFVVANGMLPLVHQLPDFLRVSAGFADGSTPPWIGNDIVPAKYAKPATLTPRITPEVRDRWGGGLADSAHRCSNLLIPRDYCQDRK